MNLKKYALPLTNGGPIGTAHTFELSHKCFKPKTLQLVHANSAQQDLITNNVQSKKNDQSTLQIVNITLSQIKSKTCKYTVSLLVVVHPIKDCQCAYRVSQLVQHQFGH